MNNPSETTQLPTIAEIASLLDHAILLPTATESAMRSEIEGLLAYPLASICIKPCAIPLAVEMLAGSSIAVCTVVGFPHGANHPAVKRMETEIALDQGAVEIDMVVNYGSAMGGDWETIRHDIQAVLEPVRARGAMLKVIFESGVIPDDATKIRLCHICSDLGVDYVKTSTGFGYVKQLDGTSRSTGATDHDLKLMREHCSPAVGVKASGGMRSLDDVLRVLPLGVTRIGTTSSIAILSQLRARRGEGHAITATSDY
jgi:deoxyribose-phosphate aldolase